MAQPVPILRVDSILKRFGTVTAVDRLSFEIDRGEVFALLGPNGAGKTTTVRMLMDILKPDEGSFAFRLGEPPGAGPPPAAELGYLPEERGLYPEIPVLKTLTFMGVVRGMDRKQAERSANAWIEKLGLTERRNQKLSALSKGNQQKVQFISSVLHRPSFAVLDEPFAGLDPLNQEAFLKIILELRDRGMTILLSAHQMDLVERIADRVLLLSHGRSIASGTVDEIKRGCSTGEKMVLQAEGRPEWSLIRDDDAVETAELLGESEIRLTLKPGKSLSGLLHKAAVHYRIASVRTEHVSLHDAFIDRVKRAIGEKNE